MRLRIPYQKYPTSYTESGFYYSASIAVSIGIPAHDSERSKRFDAIIDSGASGCLFHASIGRAIGLNIEAGERTETLGIAGETKVFLHNIWLYAPGGLLLRRPRSQRNFRLPGSWA